MVKLETIHWHTLAPQFLNPNSRILDLGANYGLFAKAITSRVGCHCVAVEPSPVPYNGIQTSKYISKIQVAVAGRSGTMSFRVEENGLASALTINANHATLAIRVTTLPELLNELSWSSVDLLKVDIEGAEIEMLAACPDDFLSKRIAQISIEFHDFCDVTPSQIVNKTLDRLHNLGFASVRMSRIGHQDTWLINRNLLKVSPSDLMMARYVTRNWLGLKRIAARIRQQFERKSLI